MLSLKAIVEHPQFERAIIGLIILNAVTLGLETDRAMMDRAGPLLTTIDRVLLAIFVLELGAKLAVYRLAFWRDPWRVFDFAVIAIALLPATGALAALRAFRIIRLLRIVSALPSLKRVVTGLLSAIPGMGSIVLLLVIVFYVFAVIATKLFSADFPVLFGSLGASAFTLFQVMTLEGWSDGVVRPIMEVHPLAWAFFIPFILITSFTVLNLFIGIIVDAMQRSHLAEAEEEVLTESHAILAEIRALRAEFNEFRAAPIGAEGKSI